METKADLTAQVLAAKKHTKAADGLVRQYLPFIKAETAKFLKRPPVEGRDDELSIAMFAFHEAVLAYDPARGAFLPLAAANIRNRLIDHARREARHSGHLSLDQKVGDNEDSRTLQEQLDTGHNNVEVHHDRSAARDEITEFSARLREFDLELTDISDNCPRQSRTLEACHKVLSHARRNPLLLRQLETSGKLPITALAKGSGVEKKTLERHRKYLVALLLAFTNGFEIIRGHLQQMAPPMEVEEQ